MGPLRLRRVPLLALGVAALVAALWAGLARIGWAIPVPSEALPAIHGPLAIGGFLGTLICLERAVALGSAWAYLAPLAAGLGGVALLGGAPAPTAQGLFAAAGLGLVASYGYFLARHASSHLGVMTLGAACWAAGTIVWMLGAEMPRVVPWWCAFLVLTIAGERLELSRVALPPRSARIAFLVAATIYVAGVAVSLTHADIGTRVEGAGSLLLAAWLARYDLARRTVHATGLTRFIAVCLLSGYAWLAVHGALRLAWGDAPPGTRYDAILHTLLLGFVMSMVFGHAPVIFPSVLGAPVQYRPAFYAHWALLHASLAVRVAGDLAIYVPARQWGGLANAIAIVVFFLNTISSAARKPSGPLTRVL